MGFFDTLDLKYRLILCDVWGVIHNGVELYPGASERLLRWRDEGRCVLFSSHVMQEVAALCDDIVIISAGRVVVRGTSAEILSQTGTTDLEEAFVQAAAQGVRP